MSEGRNENNSIGLCMCRYIFVIQIKFIIIIIETNVVMIIYLV